MSDQEHVIEVLNEENRRLSEENARLRSQLAAETEGLLKVTDERDRLHEANDHAPEVEVQRLRDQRDTLLAALRGGTFSLDYDEQQHDYVLHYHASYEEAEAIKIAISEVEGEK